MLVHKHLIVRAKVNKPPVDPELLKQWITDLIGKIDMKLLDGPHARYVNVEGNRGATGVAIIETSHIAIHVWDEPDPALVQLDVYTCGPIEIQNVFDHFEQFEPVELDYKFLDREHKLKVIKKAKKKKKKKK